MVLTKSFKIEFLFLSLCKSLSFMVVIEFSEFVSIVPSRVGTTESSEKELPIAECFCNVFIQIRDFTVLLCMKTQQTCLENYLTFNKLYFFDKFYF